MHQLGALQGGTVLRIRNSVVGQRERVPAATIRCGLAEPSGKPAPMGQKSRYQDSWLDSAIISYFAGHMHQVTGLSTNLEGYDGLVDISRKLVQSRTPPLQRQVTLQVFHSAVPAWVPKAVRKIFPPSKWTATTFAAFTVLFQWLVGPCEVKEVEVHGSIQKSAVLIKKCRLLESSNCVGMCVNLCKIPTQEFITREFGVPLTMTPNYQDMSCEMVYGQLPPLLDEDLAFKQPCYATLCATAQQKAKSCPKTPSASTSLSALQLQEDECMKAE